MGFFSDVAPRRAMRDLFAYVRQDRPHKAAFAMAAAIPPLILISAIVVEGNQLSKPPPPTVIYVESWPLNRSMADIMRDRKIREAQRAAALAQSQQAYRTLGKELGLNMKQVEADARRIRAEAQADAQVGVAPAPAADADPARR